MSEALKPALSTVDVAQAVAQFIWDKPVEESVSSSGRTGKTTKGLEIAFLRGVMEEGKQKSAELALKTGEGPEDNMYDVSFRLTELLERWEELDPKLQLSFSKEVVLVLLKEQLGRKRSIANMAEAVRVSLQNLAITQISDNMVLRRLLFESIRGPENYDFPEGFDPTDEDLSDDAYVMMYVLIVACYMHRAEKGKFPRKFLLEDEDVVEEVAAKLSPMPKRTLMSTPLKNSGSNAVHNHTSMQGTDSSNESFKSLERQVGVLTQLVQNMVEMRAGENQNDAKSPKRGEAGGLAGNGRGEGVQEKLRAIAKNSGKRDVYDEGEEGDERMSQLSEGDDESMGASTKALKRREGARKLGLDRILMLTQNGEITDPGVFARALGDGGVPSVTFTGRVVVRTDPRSREGLSSKSGGRRSTQPSHTVICSADPVKFGDPANRDLNMEMVASMVPQSVAHFNALIEEAEEKLSYAIQTALSSADGLCEGRQLKFWKDRKLILDSCVHGFSPIIAEHVGRTGLGGTVMLPHNIQRTATFAIIFYGILQPMLVLLERCPREDYEDALGLFDPRKMSKHIYDSVGEKYKRWLAAAPFAGIDSLTISMRVSTMIVGCLCSRCGANAFAGLCRDCNSSDVSQLILGAKKSVIKTVAKEASLGRAAYHAANPSHDKDMGEKSKTVTESAEDKKKRKEITARYQTWRALQEAMVTGTSSEQVVSTGGAGGVVDELMYYRYFQERRAQALVSPPAAEQRGSETTWSALS